LWNVVRKRNWEGHEVFVVIKFATGCYSEELKHGADKGAEGDETV
jgi:hypothetical protein